jgi:hypothetical protein
MADHEITPEMRMEVGEKFEEFRIAEFKPSQIYTTGPIAGFPSVILFSNANGRWQSFAFLRAHEATKHVIAYEGLGKSRLKSKAPTPFTLRDPDGNGNGAGGGNGAGTAQKRRKPASASTAGDGEVKKRKKKALSVATDDDAYGDEDADDVNGDSAGHLETAVVAAAPPIKLKIKFKAPKVEEEFFATTPLLLPPLLFGCRRRHQQPLPPRPASFSSSTTTTISAPTIATLLRLCPLTITIPTTITITMTTMTTMTTTMPLAGRFEEATQTNKTKKKQ